MYELHEIVLKKQHFLNHVYIINFEGRRHDLAVSRAGDRSYVTGSIRGWSRSYFTYNWEAADKKDKLISQSPSIAVEFSVQNNLKITTISYFFKQGWTLTVYLFH